MIKQRVSLKPINNEKKNTRVLSLKVCITDNEKCLGGANDICFNLDLSVCGGNASYDYCKYIDTVSCSGGSYDYCYYDYQACNNGSSDICVTDN